MSGTPLAWQRPRLRTPQSRERLRQPFRSPLLACQRSDAPTPSVTPPTRRGPAASVPAAAGGGAAHLPASSDSLGVSPSLTPVSRPARDAAGPVLPAESDGGASPALRTASGPAPELELELAAADAEVARLEAAGCRAEQLPLYIAALHDYNEVKDAAQLVMGRIAEMDGVTVRAVHARYEGLPRAERC